MNFLAGRRVTPGIGNGRRAYTCLQVGIEHEEAVMARARSFGNIRKLPSGRYQARCWRLGKQVAADTTFASKTDARRWLATVEADMIRGVWVDPGAGRIPFVKYATRWVAERPARPRTREIYEGQLRHIVPVFANVHLCDVHPVDVRTWHGRLAASGLAEVTRRPLIEFVKRRRRGRLGRVRR